MPLRLEHFVAALLALVVLAVIGAFGIAVGHPWLVPSLGSAVLLQTLSPQSRTAKPWNTCVGQLVAVCGGLAGVYAVGAEAAPQLTSGHTLVCARIAAMAIAIFITALLQVILKAENPAGGATALLIALGTIAPDAGGAFDIIVGIVLVTALGEAARRMSLKLQTTSEQARR